MFIIALFFQILLGWGVITWIKPKAEDWEKVGLGLLLGSQIFTFTLFIANYALGMKLDLLSCWTVMLILNIAVYAIINPGKLSKNDFPVLTLPVSWQNRTVFIILAIILCTNLFLSFYKPVVDWDAVTLFDFRAKIILNSGEISDTLFRTSFFDYPLYTSLNHFWLNLNGLSSAVPFYSLLYISFLFVMYFILKKSVSPFYVYIALIFIAFAPKMFDQSTIAYTNLPYTIYLVTGLGYLYLWTKDRRWHDLILGIILSLMTFWVRSFPFALANFAALLLISPYLRKHLKFFTGILTIILIAVYAFTIQIVPLIGILNFTKTAIFDYFFPYPYIYMILLFRQLFKPAQNKYLYWVIGLYLILYISGNIYLFKTMGNYYAGIPDAAQRMMMFINPVIIWLYFISSH